jgi:ELWxxDGT repeat protein/uncharacterized repeat protein (TIGR03803 family)
MTLPLQNALQIASMLLVVGLTAEAQPAFVKQVPDASTNFVTAGDFTYFTSNDSLFRTDGTESGTIFLKSGFNYFSNPQQFNDLLIFVSDLRFSTFRDIWRSDGTPGGTFLLKSSSQYDLVVFGLTEAYVYFSASEPATGSELFRTDGTISGTMLLRDINPGSDNGVRRPLAVVGQDCYFSADDGIHGNELWKTDGTIPGTVLVKDINPGLNHGIGEGVAAEFNNRLYFSGVSPQTGAEAWVSDGSAAGTSLLKDLMPGEPYPSSIEFGEDLDGWLYFFSSRVINSDDEESATVESDLWLTDGTTSNTMKLKSFTRCGSCDYVHDYWSYNDRLYFFFNESTDRDILYGSDGTTAGTTPVFSMGGGGGQFVGEVDGQLFFFGAANRILTPLYRTDGTPAGTDVVRLFNSASFGIRRDAAATDIVRIEDKIFFPDHDAPYDPSGGYGSDDFYQLMVSDGSATESIRSMGGGSYIGADNLVRLNGLLMFTTQDVIPNESSDGKKRLWLLDPTKPFASTGTFTLVNADTDEDLQTLNEGEVVFITPDSGLNIRFNPVAAPGSVVFKHQGRIVRRENAAPYSLGGDNSGDYLAWSGAVPGSHRIEATPYSGPGGTGTPGPSVALNFTIREESFSCSGGGSILREYWEGIPGNQVSLIPLGTPPAGTNQLTSFEGPVNAGVNYGARISGYICAPATGNFVFWIASNDESELWLSSDDDPANKTKIAFTRYATDRDQWDKYPTQRSAEIWLERGRSYYIEALHKQGGGNDHIAVGWQRPNGWQERPIGGYNLTPFSGELVSEVRIASLTEGQEFVAPANIRIEGTLSGRPGWSRVDIFAGSKKIVQASGNETFDFTWERVGPGTYPLKVVVTNDIGQVFASEVVNVIVRTACAAIGTITREQWSNITGNRVSDIPEGENPTNITSLTDFEAAALGRNYGARIRGFICPPETGDYVFWIASNDHSELWVGTDDEPLNRQRVAYVTGATDFRQWNKFRSQRSAPVRLMQGKRYYIEALHKQGVGSDHVSVGWQLPDGTMERPIGASRLSPFSEQSDLLSQLVLPLAGSTALDPLVVKLETRMVAGASRYTVEVNALADFSGESMVVTSAEDNQNIFIIKGLNSATTYYARVKTDVSGFGPVTTFTTRDPITKMRLWGITSYGGTDDVGTIFSYGLGGDGFVKHYDQPLLWDGYNYIEERLMGTLVPGPEGMFYGQMDHDYSAAMFQVNVQGAFQRWGASAYFFEAQLVLGSNNYIYATNNDTWVPGGIDRYDIGKQTLMPDWRMEPFTQNSDASTPLVELNDGYFYGAAGEGGVNEGGFIYRFRLDGSGFGIIHYFHDVVTGMKPYAGLTVRDGFLYGTTTHGGEHGNHGTIFRIRPDGTGFLKLHDFDGENGSVPMGELIVLDDVLYGTTNEGGIAGMGTVFRIDSDGTGFSRLHSFSGPDGAKPSRGLVHDREGNLYGMTSEGGSNGMGVIFSVSTTGGNFARLLDFTPLSGGRPTGALVIREDTYSPPSTFSSVSGNEQAISRVSVYPNPTTDNFEVTVYSPGNGPVTVVVMDQYGQMIESYKGAINTTLQIGSDLNRGVYIVKTVTGKTVTMHRLVKK